MPRVKPAATLNFTAGREIFMAEETHGTLFVVVTMWPLQAVATHSGAAHSTRSNRITDIQTRGHRHHPLAIEA